MQFSRTTLLAVLAVLIQADTIPNLVASLPSCAITCLTPAIAAAGCGITDYVCQCTTGHNKIQASSASCLSTTCSSDDFLKVGTITDEICSIATASGAATSAASKASSAVSSAASVVSSANSSASAAVTSAASKASSGASSASKAGSSGASAAATSAASAGSSGASTASTASSATSPSATANAGAGMKVGAAGMLGAAVVAAMAL